MTRTDTASNKRKRIDNQDKGEDGNTSDSTMTTKSTEVRNVTIENNCQPPPTSIVTQDTTVSGLTITTTMGKQLYEVQKKHFEKKEILTKKTPTENQKRSATFRRIRINVPGFVSNMTLRRTNLGTFIRNRLKVACYFLFFL